MNALLVYCHPCPESFTAAVRDVAADTIRACGHSVDLIDLYADRFEPAMSADERRGYHSEESNLIPVEGYARRLGRAEAVVFVYPTWWYGLPAMLKGWLERVLVPGFAFEMPNAHRGSRPLLHNIRSVLSLTTCGATPFVTWMMGQPGRRTLTRGFRSACHPFCRTRYLALYRMDSTDLAKRQRHLKRVRATLRSAFQMAPELEIRQCILRMSSEQRIGVSGQTDQ